MVDGAMYPESCATAAVLPPEYLSARYRLDNMLAGRPVFALRCAALAIAETRRTRYSVQRFARIHERRARRVRGILRAQQRPAATTLLGANPAIGSVLSTSALTDELVHSDLVEGVCCPLGAAADSAERKLHLLRRALADTHRRLLRLLAKTRHARHRVTKLQRAIGMLAVVAGPRRDRLREKYSAKLLASERAHALLSASLAKTSEGYVALTQRVIQSVVPILLTLARQNAEYRRVFYRIVSRTVAWDAVAPAGHGFQTDRGAASPRRQPAT